MSFCIHTLQISHIYKFSPNLIFANKIKNIFFSQSLSSQSFSPHPPPLPPLSTISLWPFPLTAKLQSSWVHLVASAAPSPSIFPPSASTSSSTTSPIQLKQISSYLNSTQNPPTFVPLQYKSISPLPS